MKKIFVVEDNENLREAVTSFLKMEGFVVYEYSGVSGVVDAVKELQPDLLILDVMLPDGDGFFLATKIRKSYDCPIVFLTARDSEASIINGFEVGADDYITKPFSTKELVMRVKAILRRGVQTKSDECNTWSLGETFLHMDRIHHQVFVNKEEVVLTQSEWKILEYLSSNSGIVIDRQKLLSNCLDYYYDGSERTIITHIKNLRAKLGDVTWIETVRGFGYRFCGEEYEG